MKFLSKVEIVCERKYLYNRRKDQIYIHLPYHCFYCVFWQWENLGFSLHEE